MPREREDPTGVFMRRVGDLEYAGGLVLVDTGVQAFLYTAPWKHDGAVTYFVHASGRWLDPSGELSLKRHPGWNLQLDTAGTGGWLITPASTTSAAELDERDLAITGWSPDAQQLYTWPDGTAMAEGDFVFAWLPQDEGEPHPLW